MATDLETTKRAPILELAWQRHAQMDVAAEKRTRGFYRIRKFIAWLGILATLFAILAQDIVGNEPWPAAGAVLPWTVKVLFILIPIVSSAFAAFATKSYSNGDWLVYRAGAEEIKKEIYVYRSILPRDKTRRDYLEKRLNAIQRKVFRNLGGEFSYEEYKGPLPKNYKKERPNSDPGFHDLTGDEYAQFRVRQQVDWHNNKINQRKGERHLMTVAILAVGAAGAFLAALGGPLAIWVAITASVTAALLGWQELKKVDETIKNYSKVVLELSILYEHWQNLEPEERTPTEFEKMVLSTERVLWTQNREFIRSMQEALRETDLEKDAAFINQMIKESADSAERAKEKMHENIIEIHHESLVESEHKIDQAAREVLGTLAEEAASEIVQKELAEMSRALTETFEGVKERAASFVSSIADVKKEFEHVEVSQDTTMEELNTIMDRYPRTNDVKG